MKVSEPPEDTQRRRLDDRLDEALAESFPASDPHAVHALDTLQPEESAPLSSTGINSQETLINFEQGAIRIDATLVAADLDIPPTLILARIREGRITSRCERGLGEDTGRFRLTFFHGNRSVRLVVDDAGNVLERSSANVGERAPSISSPSF
jgi:hypothetical protein